jgi:hypothetical protein
MSHFNLKLRLQVPINILMWLMSELYNTRKLPRPRKVSVIVHTISSFEVQSYSALILNRKHIVLKILAFV